MSCESTYHAYRRPRTFFPPLRDANDQRRSQREREGSSSSLAYRCAVRSVAVFFDARPCPQTSAMRSVRIFDRGIHRSAQKCRVGCPLRGRESASCAIQLGAGRSLTPRVCTRPLRAPRPPRLASSCDRSRNEGRLARFRNFTSTLSQAYFPSGI